MIERLPMIDGQLHPARKDDITGSVGAGLLGVHPYWTPYSLHMLKAGLVADDIDETPPMRRGRLLESVAVQMIREDYPDITLDKYPVGVYFRDPEYRIGATPDLLAKDAHGRPGVIQVKSVEPSQFRTKWKDENGVVEPPIWIVIQALIESYLTGAEWAAVAPMRVGFGVEIELIQIPLHAGIIDRLKHEAAEFWARIEAGTPPDPDYRKDADVIAKLFPRDDGSTIDLSGDNALPMIVDCLEELKATIKQSSDEKTAIETDLKARLGSHSYARIADGRIVSYKLQQRSAYSVPAGEHRVLRIGKQKGRHIR